MHHYLSGVSWPKRNHTDISGPHHQEVAVWLVWCHNCLPDRYAQQYNVGYMLGNRPRLPSTACQDSDGPGSNLHNSLSVRCQLTKKNHTDISGPHHQEVAVWLVWCHNCLPDRYAQQYNVGYMLGNRPRLPSIACQDSDVPGSNLHNSLSVRCQLTKKNHTDISGPHHQGVAVWLVWCHNCLPDRYAQQYNVGYKLGNRPRLPSILHTKIVMFQVQIFTTVYLSGVSWPKKITLIYLVHTIRRWLSDLSGVIIVFQTDMLSNIMLVICWEIGQGYLALHAKIVMFQVQIFTTVYLSGVSWPKKITPIYLVHTTRVWLSDLSGVIIVFQTDMLSNTMLVICWEIGQGYLALHTKIVMFQVQIFTTVYLSGVSWPKKITLIYLVHTIRRWLSDLSGVIIVFQTDMLSNTMLVICWEIGQGYLALHAKIVMFQVQIFTTVYLSGVSWPKKITPIYLVHTIRRWLSDLSGVIIVFQTDMLSNIMLVICWEIGQGYLALHAKIVMFQVQIFATNHLSGSIVSYSTILTSLDSVTILHRGLTMYQL